MIRNEELDVLPQSITPAYIPKDTIPEYDPTDDDNAIQRALYNSNTVGAMIYNNFSDDDSIRVRDKDVQAEKDSGFEFSWDNPKVQEEYNKIPIDIREQMSGNIHSLVEMRANAARIQKMADNNNVLHHQYGAVGAFGLQMATGLIDYDTLMPLSFIGKTKKALDLAKITSKSTRAAAYGIAGGTQAYAFDAVYQQVQGTDIADQRIFSILGGSVLSVAASRWIDKVDTTSGKLEVDDPIVGPREATLEEKATLKVEEGRLAVTASEEKLVKLKKRLGIVDDTTNIKVKGNLKDEQVRLKKHTEALEKDIVVKKKELVEAEKAAKRAKHDEATNNLNITKDAVRTHETSTAVIVKEQKVLTKKIQKLEAKEKATKETQQELGILKEAKQRLEVDLKRNKDLIKKAQHHKNKHGTTTKNQLAAKMAQQRKEIQEISKNLKKLSKRVTMSKEDISALKAAKQALIDNGNMLHNASKERSKLHGDLETATRLQKRAHSTLPKNKPEVSHRNIDDIKKEIKASEDTIISNKSALDYATNTYKRLSKQVKTYTATAKSATTRFSDAVDELDNIAEKVLDELHDGSKLELNWFEKTMLWTPSSYLHSSSNKALNKLGDLLVAPYKPKKLLDGTFAPTRPNAMFFKQQFSNIHRVMYVETLQAFAKATKEQGYKGDYKQFMMDVGDTYRQASQQALREAHSNIPSFIKGEALDEAILKAESGITVVYTNKIQAINDAAEAVKKFNITYGKAGKELGAAGMEGISLNGTYLSRNFNHEAIAKIGKPKAIQQLTQAMREHIANRDLSDEQLAKEATRVINKVSERGILYDSLIGVDNAGVHQPTSVKQRTIHYYEDGVLSLLNKDLNEDLLAYNYRMSGKLALQKALGVSTRAQITELMSKLANEDGATAKDMKNVAAVIDTVLGTREIMKNPTALGNTAMRMVAKTNSIIYGPGFGITSLTEMANIVGTTGVKNTMGLHFDAINSTFKMARGEDVPVEWINEIQAIGLVGDIVHGLHMQRYDASDSISTSNALEKALDFGNHFVHKISGLQHTTEAQRVITIGAGMNDIVGIAKNLNPSTADLKRLAVYGLQTKDLDGIRHLVDTGVIKFDGAGHLKAFGFDKWDTALSDKIQSGLYTHMVNTVLHPDGATLPLFLTNNDFVGKIMFQFLRFPAAAHEKLMLRGLDLADARQAVGILSSLALFTLVAKTKDFLKGEDRFDLDTEEGVNNLTGYLIANNYMTASLAGGSDLIYSLATGKSAWSDYTQGTASVLGVTNATYGGFQRAIGSLQEGEVKTAWDKLQTPTEHFWATQLVTQLITGEE